MTHRAWLAIALILSLVMAVGHAYALEGSWYWHFWWYDLAMHLIGGAALGALALGVVGTRTGWFWILPAFAMLAWEGFEYAAGISRGEVDFIVDTSLDTIVGLGGAYVTLLVARATRTRERFLSWV